MGEETKSLGEMLNEIAGHLKKVRETARAIDRIYGVTVSDVSIFYGQNALPSIGLIRGITEAGDALGKVAQIDRRFQNTMAFIDDDVNYHQFAKPETYKYLKAFEDYD